MKHPLPNIIHGQGQYASFSWHSITDLISQNATKSRIWKNEVTIFFNMSVNSLSMFAQWSNIYWKKTWSCLKIDVTTSCCTGTGNISIAFTSSSSSTDWDMQAEKMQCPRKTTSDLPNSHLPEFTTTPNFLKC